MPEVDTLIVGQGLAGSLLAWELIGRGSRVAVVDDGRRTAASRVAAGLINPLTGPRLALTPRFAELAGAARDHYSRLEVAWGGTFFRDYPMVRLLLDPAEREAVSRRRGDPAYAAYLGDAWGAGRCPAAVHRGTEGVWVRGAGTCDTAALVTAAARALRDNGALVEAPFDYRDLRAVPSAGGAGGSARASHPVTWQGWSARQAVFCEGYRVGENPWFRGLPVVPAAGEILDLEVGADLPEMIFSAGKWLLPMAAGRHRAGSTFRRGSTSATPTLAGREEIMAGVGRFLPAPMAVVGHAAGVRATTRDRAPLVGRHPVIPHLLALNGLGAKGALHAPDCATRLAEHLLRDAPLPPGIDLRRCGTGWTG